MSRIIFRIGITAMALLLGLASIGYAQTFTTFDVPGSTNTSALAINPAGQITGTYVDTSGFGHGFLRQPDGTFTTLDVPGAGATSPFAINPAGQITGTCGVGNTVRGFLRQPDGTFTTFEVPGSFITFPEAINPAGQITGEHDAGGASHGYLKLYDSLCDKPGRPDHGGVRRRQWNPRLSTAA